MIALHDVQVFFPGQVLLEGVTLRVLPHQRLGLVGSNGSGKSTLVRLMAGELEPTAGAVERERGVTLGYLPQSGVTCRGRTLWQEMLAAVPEWLELRGKRRELRATISALSPGDPESRKHLTLYGEIESRYQQQNGYAQESRLEKILLGLGFLKEDLQRQVEEFSAGWQMRIGLAKVLARDPAFLLLDEPTDHLDLDAKNWLEDYLKHVKAGFLLVSHDRHFLDNLVEGIVEIDDKKLEVYVGNYARYIQEKKKCQEEKEARFLQQQDKIRGIEEFISRNRVRKDRARQVQSRIRMLERLERVDRATKPAVFRFTFPPAPRAPKVLLSLDKVEKCFSSRVIFCGLDLRIERGERIAVVGPNGSGKSTLLRILAGREPLQSGIRLLDGSVSVGWFSQDASGEFRPTSSLIEAILEVSPLMTQEKIRALLARFGFREDSVFKPVEALSGGERARLALSRLLLHRHHLLLLDEPTNHLDIQARQALLDALLSYQGTVVFVSHDRYFIQELGTRVLEIQGGAVRSRVGSYEDYLAARELGDRDFVQLSGEPSPAGAWTSRTTDADGKEERRQERESRKKLQREEQRRQRELAETEEKISMLEAELQVVMERMSSPELASDYPGLRELHGRGTEIREALKGHYQRWEELLNP